MRAEDEFERRIARMDDEIDAKKVRFKEATLADDRPIDSLRGLPASDVGILEPGLYNRGDKFLDDDLYDISRGYKLTLDDDPRGRSSRSKSVPAEKPIWDRLGETGSENAKARKQAEYRQALQEQMFATKQARRVEKERDMRINITGDKVPFIPTVETRSRNNRPTFEEGFGRQTSPPSGIRHRQAPSTMDIVAENGLYNQPFNPAYHYYGLHDPLTLEGAQYGDSYLARDAPQPHLSSHEVKFSTDSHRPLKQQRNGQPKDDGIWDPWGRGGGGAPLRDNKGSLIADLREMHLIAETGQQTSYEMSDVDPTLIKKEIGGARELFTDTPRPGINADPLIKKEEQLSTQDAYKSFLNQQIEEKRLKKEEETRLKKEEEVREEKRLADQRKRMEDEFNFEQERIRKKEEDTRLKNEEIQRALQEQRDTRERQKLEDEQKREEAERRRIEREQSEMRREEEERLRREDERRNKKEEQRKKKLESSPAKKQHVTPRQTPRKTAFTVDKSTDTPRRKIVTYTSDKGTSPTVPTTPEDAKRSEINRQLSAMRKQLKSEQSRIEKALRRSDRREVPNTSELDRTFGIGKPPVEASSERDKAELDRLRPFKVHDKEFHEDAHYYGETLQHPFRSNSDLVHRRPPMARVRSGPDVSSAKRYTDVITVPMKLPNDEQQPLWRPIFRPESGDDTDPVVGQEFNKLKYYPQTKSRNEFRRDWPEAPITADMLEAQQLALIRHQEEDIKAIKEGKKLDKDDLQRFGATPDKELMPLQSESSFMAPNGTVIPVTPPYHRLFENTKDRKKDAPSRNSFEYKTEEPPPRDLLPSPASTPDRQSTIQLPPYRPVLSPIPDSGQRTQSAYSLSTSIFPDRPFMSDDSRLDKDPVMDNESLKSVDSFDVGKLTAKNAERLRKLRRTGDDSDDALSLGSHHEDVLKRFMEQKKHNRPPSVGSLDSEAWLKPSVLSPEPE